MTTDFNGFGLPPKLLQALARMEFTTPTPIQEQAIPLALTGRDILGSAQTGTGKTGAFGIPIIAKLMDNAQAAALIMTPTRELAAQVMAALQQMIPIPSIRTALLIGGEPMPKQFRQLQGHPRLVVGTPGRIHDHLQRGSLKLNNTRFLVLDETDRMLDMGFGIQIERIVAHVPKERQTMLFSATLPSGIVKLSSKYLNNPERISVGSMTQAAPNITQELIQTTDSDKYTKLLEQLNAHKGSAIIFVKTKYGTEKLADKLSKLSHRSDAIHGDLRQSRRDKVIQGFRDKKFRILVATDLAARGLDVPHIELVINYDMPQCPEDYIHRIGRTARAGASGKAINFLTSADRIKWNAIQRLMNPNAPRMPEAKGEARPNKYRRGGGKPFHGGGGRRFDRSEGEGGQRREHFGKRPDGEQRRDRPVSERTVAPRQEGGEQRRERPVSNYRPAGERPTGHRHESEQRRERPAGGGYRPAGERHAASRHEGSEHRKDRPAAHRHETGEQRRDRPVGERPAGQRHEGGAQRRDGAASTGHRNEGHRQENKGAFGKRRTFKPRSNDRPRAA